MTQCVTRVLDTRIGANLRLAREAAALDIDAVARAVGHRNTDIVAIEAGDVRLSAREVTAFANVLQVEISTLFADTIKIESFRCEKAKDRGDLLTDLMMQGRQNSALKNLVALMRKEAGSGELREHAA